MRALVAGGAGFIGSHLCDLLLEKKYDVLCIDNLITGDMKNVEHIDSDRFAFIKHDITKPVHLANQRFARQTKAKPSSTLAERNFARQTNAKHSQDDDKIDLIFHLASPASPVDYLNLPVETLEVGAAGTHNMLDLAKEHNARFIFASTSEVYGDPLVNPQSEGYWGNVNPIGPRSVYDESKRYAEALVMAYNRHFKVDTGIARIFNTYGPRIKKNDGRVVPNFINQALSGDDLTVYGDGSQTRSFCYMSDMVDGIYGAAVSSFSDPINLGNPNEISVLEFANIVLNMTKSDSKIVFKPLPVDDPKIRRPDISRAMDVLKWKPVVGLDEGLSRTIEYFSRNDCV